jgi:hypothetical protein
MFSTEERARTRDQLLKRAEADDAIVGAAYTGSLGTGADDRWSDTDLVLAVRGELAPALIRWTDWLYTEHKAQHHWDLQVGPKLIRVFLLPGWLELDLTFAPEADFAPRGPQWQTIFGQAQPLDPYPPTDRHLLAGLLWHHALHARICLARRRWWQAEHWISAMRDHVITMACARLGLPAANAKGADLLPDDLTAPLQATLVRELTATELRRTLTAIIAVATDEIARFDPALAARLRPMLAELADPSPDGVAP